MGKVLIIDDENQLRKLLSRIIGLEGYEVLQADSCKSGMKQLVFWTRNSTVSVRAIKISGGITRQILLSRLLSAARNLTMKGGLILAMVREI